MEEKIKEISNSYEEHLLGLAPISDDCKGEKTDEDVETLAIMVESENAVSAAGKDVDPKVG